MSPMIRPTSIPARDLAVAVGAPLALLALVYALWAVLDAPPTPPPRARRGGRADRAVRSRDARLGNGHAALVRVALAGGHGLATAPQLRRPCCGSVCRADSRSCRDLDPVVGGRDGVDRLRLRATEHRSSVRRPRSVPGRPRRWWVGDFRARRLRARPVRSPSAAMASGRRLTRTSACAPGWHERHRRCRSCGNRPSPHRELTRCGRGQGTGEVETARG